MVFGGGLAGKITPDSETSFHENLNFIIDILCAGIIIYLFLPALVKAIIKFSPWK